MARRSLSFVSASLVLLMLALFVPLLPSVYAFTNGQAATLVLGQNDFTSKNFATTASEMDSPSDVAVDPTSGKVFVGDADNNRVLRFASGGALVSGAAAEGVLGQSDFTSRKFAPTASGMDYQSSVVVDSAGRLWVAEGASHLPIIVVASAEHLLSTNGLNNRVLRFDSAASKANGAAADGVLGQSDFTRSNSATTASGMDIPVGLGLDSAGNLWVADMRNNRALRFDGPLLPTITWTPPAAITFGTALSATQLNATADVLGTFSYTPGEGTVLNVGAAQTLSVTFTPTDIDTYYPVAKTVTTDVNKAPQTITFAALPSKTLGAAPFTLSATTNSGLPISYSSTTPSVCTVSGNTVTLIAAGTCTITATQAGGGVFDAAAPVTQSFIVVPNKLRVYLPMVKR